MNQSEAARKDEESVKHQRMRLPQQRKDEKSQFQYPEPNAEDREIPYQNITKKRYLTIDYTSTSQSAGFECNIGKPRKRVHKMP